MNKLTILLTFLVFLCSCSFDSKSNLWENKKKKSLILKANAIDFNKKMDFNQFKKNVIMYGKFSEFPDIDN